MAKPGYEMKRELRSLINACEQAIKLLDDEMEKPSDFERGKRIARILNALDMAKDSAKHFGLGLPL